MATKRVALVTGANKGIGLEIARQLAGKGITVLVGARDQAKASAAAEQLKSEGLDAHPLPLDVANQSDIEKAAAEIQQKFGQLDILINNAGVSDAGLPDVTPEKFRSVYETNVFGPFALTRALLPLLKASPAGRIVNQSSVLGSLSSISKGQGGTFTSPAYTSSKAALNMLDRGHGSRTQRHERQSERHPSRLGKDRHGRTRRTPDRRRRRQNRSRPCPDRTRRPQRSLPAQRPPATLVDRWVLDVLRKVFHNGDDSGGA